MYALYEKTRNSNADENYKFGREISLFGCNSGWIPWLLSHKLDKNDTEPFLWHLAVSDELRKEGYENGSLIINLKPKSSKPNLSLYEIANIWGYSDCGWTPIMLHLRGLFVDENPAKFNDKDFMRSTVEIDEPIFSKLYLSGSVNKGEIVGKWNAPRPSPTNSVLLWPDTFNYFYREAQKIS